MDLKKLKLHNFRSHTDTEISFDQDFYMIQGRIQGEAKSNGSGKSSIPEAIAYCNFGNADTGVSNDSFIYNDADKMFVEALYEVNGEEIFVRRSVKRGSSPVLKITKNGEEFNPGLKAGQEMINEILGADFNIYRNTSYFKQGDLNSFSSLTPKEAKEVLISILQLDNYNKYEQLAREMSSKVGKAIIPMETTINYLKANIAEIESTNIGKESEENLNNLKETLTKINFDKETQNLLLKSKEVESNAYSVILQDKGEEINKVQYKVTDLTDKINMLKALSENAVCPTCSHNIDKVKLDAIVEDLKKEREPIIKSQDIKLKEREAILQKFNEVNSFLRKTINYDSEILRVSNNIVELETELNNTKIYIDKAEGYRNILIEKKIELEKKFVLKESYDKLQVAFGKKGIQAHIIDSVIPEIQATTNDILEGLETRIRLSIDSQKELKKGGKAETLDINIITEFGERPYTNYSGGEKTLIDFALRIALSVILTRRSNCRIQTLILDEVFGELDAENKNIISRALTYIANKFDFKKIIIISHAEELQDSFNNIIRVVFDGTSSYIEKEKADAKSEQYV